MIKKLFNFLLSGFLILLLSLCSQPAIQEHLPVRIAVSKKGSAAGFAYYDQWLRSADTGIVLIDMYTPGMDSAAIVFITCDGLLLTGGTDVYPGLYGKEYDTARCETPDFKRDSLELMLLALAIEKGMPVMGVCRGHQILNVSRGGTLVIDIPSDIGTDVNHRAETGFNCYHGIRVKQGTLLHEITGADTGTVNSAHHQAVELSGEGLEAIAFSEDGVIESVGYQNGKAGHFLLGVQWHPERLDFENPFSGKIAERFISEVKQFQKLNIHE
jgi:putative glutamine amidotransferase